MAGITASWAAESGRGLARCVVDRITKKGTATLECVVQAKPVTGFMSESVTQVVWRGRASRERGIAYNDTVIFGVTCIG